MRKDFNILGTHAEVCSTIGSKRFNWFSEWSKLQGAIRKLITVVRLVRSKSETLTQDNITATQGYHKEEVVIKPLGPLATIECIQLSGKLSRPSILEKPSPMIDGEGTVFE